MVIILAVLLFGPKRIPEIARQVGKALSELRRASDGFMREVTRQDGLGPGPPEPGPPSDGVSEGPEESEYSGAEGDSRPKVAPSQLREAASKLGIETEGKSIEEIRSEMMERIYAASADEEAG
jgi:TatA/E family protein of Tat protein translocase